ncbi:MAG: hypothetical protein JWO71_1712 [Candidatus Acidoferrum typicum]|nr:hypothetical protein [Candidatus Acidoferrum typicum]
MKAEDLKSHSALKREQMQSKSKRRKLLLQDPAPVDGQPLPDAAEGWTPDKPKADNTLSVSAVKNIRMSDGSSRKFYRMSVPVTEVKRMKKRARLLARNIRREDAKAAKKAARRTARELLFRMGKI